jgi:hypothetical protein
MACEVAPHTVEFILDTKNQTSDQVRALFEEMLRVNNVIQCGIMQRFAVTFAPSPGQLHDKTPSPALMKLGVVSMQTTAS